MLYLDSEDPNKPIYLYINCPGGSVIAGLALFDTMNHVKAPIVTINLGLAASMASFLLAAGKKGSRMALPNSRVMIHQPMGGAQGQAEDIKVGGGGLVGCEIVALCACAQRFRVGCGALWRYRRVTG